MKYERYLVHSIPLGYQRLYYAPFDVVGALPLEGGADLRSAPPAFKSLFLAYLEDIEREAGQALADWAALVEGQLPAAGSIVEARKAAFARRPGGPATQAAVVDVVRHYWLECSGLPQGAAEATRVLPQDLLLRWPREVRKDEVVAVLTAMPYWPVGLDDNGNWC